MKTLSLITILFLASLSASANPEVPSIDLKVDKSALRESIQAWANDSTESISLTNAKSALKIAQSGDESHDDLACSHLEEVIQIEFWNIQITITQNG